MYNLKKPEQLWLPEILWLTVLLMLPVLFWLPVMFCYLYCCGKAGCSVNVRMAEPAHRGVLPDIHARAHRALPVDEVGEGEGEVATLGLFYKTKFSWIIDKFEKDKIDMCKYI